MVYIHSREDGKHTLPHNPDCASVLYGAEDCNFEWRLTSYAEVVSGRFDLLIKDNLFAGSVDFMNAVFTRIGITNVKLPRNSNRESEVTTIGEVRRRVRAGERLFLKPTEIKLFTGFVMDVMTVDSMSMIKDDVEVMVYEPFDVPIVSEWRVYIYNHQVCDSRNYSGDPTISPNYTSVNYWVNVNKKDFPCAYTMDVAILAHTQNVIVEYNDMWAIGNYGMRNDTYVRILKRRYMEIVKG